MQNAVVKFIEGLRPQDRVALGSFDEPFDVHVRWTADRTMIVSGLDKVVRNRESNGTRFYSALDRTLKNEFKNVTGRRAVVVLTDGKDTDLAFETDRDLRRVLKTSQEARIPIYIIALEDERDKYVILETAKRYLHDIRENMLELADRSGGRLVFSKRLEDIAPLYEDIARGLGTSYSLGYVPSKGVAGAHHRIEVKAKRERAHVTQSRSDYIAR